MNDGQPIDAAPCGGCGGPCLYDTSISSPLWNAVIRANGLPDFLCLACIVRAFVVRGESFTAILSGDGVAGAAIEVRVNGATPRDVDLLGSEFVALRRVVSAMADEFEATSAGPNRRAITLRKALAAAFENERLAALLSLSPASAPPPQK